MTDDASEPARRRSARPYPEHAARNHLLRTRDAPSTRSANHLLQRPMKRLTPLEHARAKGKIIAMSTSDRGPEARARMIAWLEQRPSDGWFYASGDNFYFSAAVDANAFKQRLIAEMAT